MRKRGRKRRKFPKVHEKTFFRPERFKSVCGSVFDPTGVKDETKNSKSGDYYQLSLILFLLLLLLLLFFFVCVCLLFFWFLIDSCLCGATDL